MITRYTHYTDNLHDCTHRYSDIIIYRVTRSSFTMNVREVDPSSLSQDQGPFRLAISSQAMVGYSKKDGNMNGTKRKGDYCIICPVTVSLCKKSWEMALWQWALSTWWISSVGRTLVIIDPIETCVKSSILKIFSLISRIVESFLIDRAAMKFYEL